MGMALFFGDSFTSSDNQYNASYVDFLKYSGTTYNLGVNGTTFGDYSIYPVGHTSFLDRIYEQKDKIERCDDLYFSYGINDAVAVALGYVSLQHIYIDILKCVDLIKQFNPNVQLNFICFSYNGCDKMAYQQASYLSSDYAKIIVSNYCSDQDLYYSIKAHYGSIVNFVVNKLQIRTIYGYKPECILDKCLSSDNIHPNVEGMKLIANEVNLSFKRAADK